MQKQRYKLKQKDKMKYKYIAMAQYAGTALFKHLLIVVVLHPGTMIYDQHSKLFHRFLLSSRDEAQQSWIQL
jgi:hypothetical protein